VQDVRQFDLQQIIESQQQVIQNEVHNKRRHAACWYVKMLQRLLQTLDYLSSLVVQFAMNLL